MNKHVLLYLVKSPFSGMTKSRLANTLGKRHAAELYDELAEMNLSRIRPLLDENISIIIFLNSLQDHESLKSLSGDDFQFMNQEGADLSESLLIAFKDLFDGGAEKIVLLGSDTMEFRPGLIEESFSRLDRCDIVLGPAKSGGCYLIGLSRNIPFLFHEVPWDSPDLLNGTVEKANRLQFTFEKMEELEALDSLQGMNFLSRIII